MPIYRWLYHKQIGNPERRKKDRDRKTSGAGVKCVPRLASYPVIEQYAYRKVDVGGHKLHYYRLCDLAAIMGVSLSTVRRWYTARMIPDSITSFCYSNAKYLNAETRGKPAYLKQQIMVICNVLNDLYEQGFRQFRKSHTEHIAMMQAGDEMVRRRVLVKLAQEPKKPLRILPNPKEWKKLAEIRKNRIYLVPYREESSGKWWWDRL